MSRELLGQFDLFNESLARSKICFNCKKRLSADHFYKNKDRLNSYCIECQKAYFSVYSKDNKDSLNRKAQEKLATDEGMIRALYNSIKNKERRFLKKMKEGKIDLTEKQIKQFYECKVTYEELLEIWKEQQKKYGMHCPLSGQVMSLLRKNSGRRGPGNAYSNTVSIDRLDPNLCYEKRNIIFIANEVNLRKNKVYYTDCVKIIELHKERFPERFK